MTAACPTVSVIIPAFNEESYVGATLDSVARARQFLGQDAPLVEIIVVDSGSTDRTAEVARARGASIIEASSGNVALARNAGARAASGELLVFVDADTHWPETLLRRIVTVMADGRCLGGAVDTDHRPKSAVVYAYLASGELLEKCSTWLKERRSFALRTSSRRWEVTTRPSSWERTVSSFGASARQREEWVPQ